MSEMKKIKEELAQVHSQIAAKIAAAGGAHKLVPTDELKALKAMIFKLNHKIYILEQKGIV